MLACVLTCLSLNEYWLIDWLMYGVQTGFHQYLFLKHFGTIPERCLVEGVSHRISLTKPTSKYVKKVTVRHGGNQQGGNCKEKYSLTAGHHRWLADLLGSAIMPPNDSGRFCILFPCFCASSLRHQTYINCSVLGWTWKIYSDCFQKSKKKLCTNSIYSDVCPSFTYFFSVWWKRPKFDPGLRPRPLSRSR